MTRDEAVVEVADLLGALIDDDIRIIRQMKLAQSRLETGEFLPWFLEKIDSTLQNDASNLDQIDLPSDWIGDIQEFQHLFLLDDDGNVSSKIDKDDWEAIIEARSTYSSGNRDGTPTHFAIVARKIRLGPLILDEQKTFEYIYYASDTVLDTNVENDWLKYAPDMLIAKTAERMARLFRDADGLSLARDMYLEAERTTYLKHVAVREEGGNPQMRYNG